MVLKGLGVSILPHFLVAEDLKEGRLSKLYPQENFKFHMKFIKRRTGILSLAAQKLIRKCDEI